MSMNHSSEPAADLGITLGFHHPSIDPDEISAELMLERPTVTRP
jgi:hypothetical protein